MLFQKVLLTIISSKNNHGHSEETQVPQINTFFFPSAEAVPTETQQPSPPVETHSALPTRLLDDTETAIIGSALPTQGLLDNREPGHTGAVVFLFCFFTH